MFTIMAIGGAVIKTARDLLQIVIEQRKVDVLVHNGGSIFHDFQLALEGDKLGSWHSYPLDMLLEDYSINGYTSSMLCRYLGVYPYNETSYLPPDGSITKLCVDLKIPVLMFTCLGADFWQMFGSSKQWADLGKRQYDDFTRLCTFMRKEFHYICMGSAVIHPEVFIKALAVTGADTRSFTTTVVDFNQAYRPLTRVAKFGNYYQCTHRQYLERMVEASDGK